MIFRINAFILLILFFFPMISLAKTIHVFVALVDNAHQQIVPVPRHLGNGDHPSSNLYWGALYGIKTHFQKSSAWRLVQSIRNPEKDVLERLIFVHQSGHFLVADAYRGRRINKAMENFFRGLSGEQPKKITVRVKQVPHTLTIHGGADLTVYVGHNGLMESELEQEINQHKFRTRKFTGEAMVLACQSKSYFGPIISQINAKGILMTTGNMAPEAYTLEAALQAWIAQDKKNIRRMAAKAYSKYQKISLPAASRLFDSHAR